MSAAALGWGALTAAGCLGLVASDWRGFRPGAWVAKPLASTGFLGFAVACGALESLYGQVVLGALVLGWLGDVLLLPRGSSLCFLLGLGSFLLGHAAFGVAFSLLPMALGWGLGGAVLVAAGGFAIRRWLRPHVPDDMRIPVDAYLVVIGAMVALAAAATGAGASALVLAGALAFAVSDVSVARDRFVAPSPRNGAWGLPLYYAAQLLLAASVAAV